MKGIVFTEFIEMVENRFGFTVMQQLIDDTQPKSGAVYTAVGTYPHQEVVAYLIRLSEISGVAVPELLNQFGQYLFSRLAAAHPELMQKATNALDFLEGIENYIHVQVLKLYPDAELPRFDITRNGPDSLTMIYRSNRSMAPLAEGLIRGCAHHFGETLHIAAAPLDASGQMVAFTISRSRA